MTILTGSLAPLGDTNKLSGIAKTPATGPLWLGPEGFEGDAQADRRVHGGVEKAVHHYPFDHYADWRADLGNLPLLNSAGAFGENISTTDMTEKTVAVGDVFRLGDALIQVSQGRQPCWKLNYRFGVADMARRVQDTGRTGWYYRVLQPGRVSPEDKMILVDRLAPDWPMRRLWHVMYIDRLNLDLLTEIAALDVLADGWRRYARRRLESGRVEDWRPRLEGSS